MSGTDIVLGAKERDEWVTLWSSRGLQSLGEDCIDNQTQNYVLVIAMGLREQRIQTPDPAWEYRGVSSWS